MGTLSKRNFYKINNKIFLENETAIVHYSEDGSAFCNGLEGEEVVLHELMDITTEMKTGESDSFYVTTLEYFEKATEEEYRDAENYLNSIK